MRGDADHEPTASVIIPVNAQGDLDNVRSIIDDIARYDGRNVLELILVVNNYPPDQPPASIESFQELGIRVVSIPDVRRPGEAVGFTARIPGVRAARSEICLLFDADCRIPDSTSLFDWYIEQLSSGAHAAYSHVAYHDLRPRWSVRARVAIHHLSRWVKREVLRIPTTRGSNYAVRRSTMIELYDAGMLADEMNVGPSMKARAGRVTYSGSRRLVVLTSGRMFSGGWTKLARYLIYRLKYNCRVLPVRAGVAGHTGRENDPVRRYVNNRPVTRGTVTPGSHPGVGSVARHRR
jgi:glycosyltransferase involved in cell wall biosynthesis